MTKLTTEGVADAGDAAFGSGSDPIGDGALDDECGNNVDATRLCIICSPL
jgi:hypothetical protein